MASNDGSVRLEVILNARDLGQCINHTADNRLLHPGLFYRSARLDAATPSDRACLTTEVGIRTVIDLRTPTEHLEARKKFTAFPTPSSPPQPLRIPGVTYEDINLNGDAYTNALLRHLSWPRTAQLYALYALGYRKEAIGVLAADVMTPRGLSGLAIDTLTHCGPEIRSVFDVLSTPASYPVLVHCTQGKDRTGLVVLLVLLLCRVDPEAIERDYMASQAGLAPERAEKVAEVRSIGLPDEFADCEVVWVGKVIEFIDAQGGVVAYLEKCGIGAEQRGRVIETLRV